MVFPWFSIVFPSQGEPVSPPISAQVAAFVICALPLVWAGLVEGPDLAPTVLKGAAKISQSARFLVPKVVSIYGSYGS